LTPLNHSVEPPHTEQLREVEELLVKEGFRILVSKFFRMAPLVICDEILMVGATNRIHHNAIRCLMGEAMSSKFYSEAMFVNK